jgi:hypothetical protein
VATSSEGSEEERRMYDHSGRDQENTRNRKAVCGGETDVCTETDGYTGGQRVSTVSRGRRNETDEEGRHTETDASAEQQEVDSRNVDATTEVVVGVDDANGGDDVELAELLDEGEGRGDHGCVEEERKGMSWLLSTTAKEEGGAGRAESAPWDAMIALRMANTQTTHQKGLPTPPGIELKKMFGRTSPPCWMNCEPWPRYCSKRRRQRASRYGGWGRRTWRRRQGVTKGR